MTYWLFSPDFVSEWKWHRFRSSWKSAWFFNSHRGQAESWFDCSAPTPGWGWKLVQFFSSHIRIGWKLARFLNPHTHTSRSAESLVHGTCHCQLKAWYYNMHVKVSWRSVWFFNTRRGQLKVGLSFQCILRSAEGWLEFWAHTPQGLEDTNTRIYMVDGHDIF